MFRIRKYLVIGVAAALLPGLTLADDTTVKASKNWVSQAADLFKDVASEMKIQSELRENIDKAVKALENGRERKTVRILKKTGTHLGAYEKGRPAFTELGIRVDEVIDFIEAGRLESALTNLKLIKEDIAIKITKPEGALSVHQRSQFENWKGDIEGAIRYIKIGNADLALNRLKVMIQDVTDASDDSDFLKELLSRVKFSAMTLSNVEYDADALIVELQETCDMIVQVLN